MLKTEIAESVKCEFCGRNLKQEKLIIIIGDVETKINKEVIVFKQKNFGKYKIIKEKKNLNFKKKEKRIEEQKSYTIKVKCIQD